MARNSKFQSSGNARRELIRIVSGYEPREPATFPEKAFYIWGATLCALRILAEGVKRRVLRKRLNPDWEGER